MSPRHHIALIGMVLLLGAAMSAVLVYMSSDTDRKAPMRSTLPGKAVANTSSRKPLPPSGQPLVSTFDELTSRANGGDALAAQRLFTDASECLQVAQLKARLVQLSRQRGWVLQNAHAWQTPKGSADGATKQTLDVIEGEIDRIEHAQQLCAGATANIDDGRIYQIALNAARLGDSNATACLLMAPYRSPKFTPQDGQNYVDEVMRLADLGIHAGNWRVAIAMTFAYGGQFRGPGYGGLMTSYDPLKELEYSELLSLGTVEGSPDAANLSRRLSILESLASPLDRTQAINWAQQAYNNYYFFSGPVFPDSQACPD